MVETQEQEVAQPEQVQALTELSPAELAAIGGGFGGSFDWSL
ncbi:MAG TPA: hypothetical protein VNK91_04425 [Burkholderiaceae bacterium]|nr:hypothetical protein [Burkholderiaceae bacterium]